MTKLTDQDVTAYAYSKGVSIETVGQYSEVCQQLQSAKNGLKMNNEQRIIFAKDIVKKTSREMNVNEASVTINQWREFLSDNGFPPMSATEFLNFIKDYTDDEE